MRTTRLLNLAALSVAALLFLGCDSSEAPQEAPPPMSALRVPADLLPEITFGPDGQPAFAEWKVRVMAAWVSAHAGDADEPYTRRVARSVGKAGAGDDDMPDTICGFAGPPICWHAYDGVNICRDACQKHYWQMSEAGVCVDAMTGEWFRCDGSARH